MTTSAMNRQEIPSPRECDCPEWVIRCAHFEGRLVLLATNARGRKPCPIRKSTVPNPNRRVVATASRPYEMCPCGCGVLSLLPDTVLHRSESVADALAAFYAAEEELLRGAS